MADSNKITFKDIEKANSSIKTMQISRWDKKQGKEIIKEYAEVNQRIKAFRMLYPDGFIRTFIISHEDGIVLMRADVGYFDEAGSEKILASGMAFEDKKNGMINGTSYIENCETSAVGRALGMMGLGIDMSIASYEEVSNAMAQQNKPAPAPAKPQKASKKLICGRCGKEMVSEQGHSPEAIAKVTTDQLGKPYCLSCATIVKTEMMGGG